MSKKFCAGFDGRTPTDTRRARVEIHVLYLVRETRIDSSLICVCLCTIPQGAKKSPARLFS